MGKKGRRIGSLLAAVLVVLGLAFLAFRSPPVPVDLGAVVAGPMAVEVAGSGTTRVRNVYVVSTPIGGRLLRIEKEAGDLVVGGQTVVATILPHEPELLDARSRRLAEAAVDGAAASLGLAQAQVDRSRAELGYARSDYDRTVRLAERGNASQAALDEAQMMVGVAEAALATAHSGVEVAAFDLEAARARLVEPDAFGADIAEADENAPDCCVQIRSPVSGQVLRLFLESQAVVAAGTPLMEIGDVGDMEIVVDLLSEDAVKVADGAAVEIVQWGGARPLAGRVRRVEPYGFEEVSALGVEEQRVNVLIDLTSPRDEWAALGHGFAVEARIEIWASESALTVPIGALYRNADQWAVFVDDDGTARARSIEVGETNGTQAEILGGIEAGTRVVLYPSDRIADGVAIVERRAQ